MQNDKTTRALLEASKAMNASLDLRATLQAIADQAAVVMQGAGASVLLLDERRNRLIFKAAHGDKAQQLIGEEFDASLGIAGKVVTTRQSAIVNDVSTDTNFFKGIDSKVDHRTESIICSPMIHRDRMLGVIEVLNKLDGPFTDADVEFLEVFANLAAMSTANAQDYEFLKREKQTLQQSIFANSDIVGNSGSLADVLALVVKVAKTQATVLLLGETGTGKELIAKTIHQRSDRADHPFVAVNCAALPEGLLESELFGHEKGSFTGAVGQKAGRFELADGGTMFLDEVGELTPAIQVKLLRVLQEREFVRVGGTKTVATDVRIVAATNRDLKQMMQDGTFREDLYYRLNVFPIVLPPLRDRVDDIPTLAEYTIDRASRQLAIARPVLSSAARDLLIQYAWPGNIREMQNVIERAVLLASPNTILPEHLPKEITGSGCGASANGVISSSGAGLVEQEKRLIVSALEDTQWNQSRAAEKLGITRDVLRYRMKKHNLNRRVH